MFYLYIIFLYFRSKKHERHPKGVWFHSEIDHIYVYIFLVYTTMHLKFSSMDWNKLLRIRNFC